MVWPLTQPIDIISRSLRAIGALASGETPNATQTQDAFGMLNDLLETASNEDMMILYSSDVVHPITPGQFTYTIGPSGNINSVFTGTISGFTLTVAGPPTSGAINLNQTISGAGVIPGTRITAFNTGTGDDTFAAGTYTVDKAQTVGPVTMTGFYQRPLGISSAYVRVSFSAGGQPILGGGLDYPVAVITQEQYNSIGLKSLNGPWPRAIFYNASELNATINYWPNPAQGEMHLIVDTLLSNFSTINDTIQLAQGYEHWLRWGLAELLLAEYQVSSDRVISLVTRNAAKAKGALKRTNMQPVKVATFDEVLLPGYGNDAGWILHGGGL